MIVDIPCDGTSATETGIILLTVYAKSEQVNIAAEDIRNIITEYEQRAIADKENI